MLEYQNYEEEIEDIIFNLVHGIDVEITEAKVKAYQKQNISEITKNQSKLSEIERQNELRLMEEEIAFKTKSKEFKVKRLREFSFFPPSNSKVLYISRIHYIESDWIELSMRAK